MDSTTTLLIVVACFVRTIYTNTSNDTVIDEWTVTRIENQHDEIYHENINKESCQKLIRTQYNGRTKKCECSYPAGIFYIKNGKPGCYLKKTICESIGTDCQDVPIKTRDNSHRFTMQLPTQSINAAGCSNVIQKGSMLWTDGKWNKDNIAVNISKVSNSEYKVRIVGTESLNGMLIGLNITCNNGMKESVQIMFLLKVEGKAIITLFTGSETSHIDSSVNVNNNNITTTNNNNIDNRTIISNKTTDYRSKIRPSSKVILEPSQIAKLQATVFTVIKQTHIIPSRHTQTKIIEPSAIYTKLIQPSRSVFITKSSANSNKADNDSATSIRNHFEVSQTEVIQPSRAIRLKSPNESKVSQKVQKSPKSTSMILIHDSPTKNDGAAKSPEIDRNLMIIIVALVCFVIILVTAVVLLIRARKSKLSANLKPTNHDVANPTYAQAHYFHQQKDKSRNKKDLGKTESQQGLKEYASLEDDEHLADFYHPLVIGNTFNKNKRIPPRPLEHIYAYTNPVLILPGATRVNSTVATPRTLRAHPTYLETFHGSIKRENQNDKSLPDHLNRKIVYIDTEAGNQKLLAGRRSLASSTTSSENEPVYVEPNVNESVKLTSAERLYEPSSGNSQNINTTSLDMNHFNGHTQSSNPKEPFYFETEKEDCAGGNCTSEQLNGGYIHEPVYCEPVQATAHFCYETIPYDSVRKDGASKERRQNVTEIRQDERMGETALKHKNHIEKASQLVDNTETTDSGAKNTAEYEQINKKNSSFHAEHVYSVIPMILNEISKLKKLPEPEEIN